MKNSRLLFVVALATLTLRLSAWESKSPVLPQSLSQERSVAPSAAHMFRASIRQRWRGRRGAGGGRRRRMGRGKRVKSHERRSRRHWMGRHRSKRGNHRFGERSHPGHRSRPGFRRRGQSWRGRAKRHWQPHRRKSRPHRSLWLGRRHNPGFRHPRNLGPNRSRKLRHRRHRRNLGPNRFPKPRLDRRRRHRRRRRRRRRGGFSPRRRRRFRMEPFRDFSDFNRRFPRPRSFSRICHTEQPNFRTFDGYCNNRRHRTYGAANHTFLRTAPRNVYGPPTGTLPSPRLISNIIHGMGRGPPIALNRKGLSEMVMYFGQFLDHTFAETENNVNDTWNIPIPSGDPDFVGGEIEFFRTRKVSGVPLNLHASYIDAQNIYGGTAEEAESHRTMHGGKLNTSTGNFLPLRQGGKLFESGDSRVNENPVLMAFHTLFVREHNRLCDEISIEFPDLNDEMLYQMARQIVVAELQAIVYYEFLPAVVGRIPRYRRYHPQVNAAISDEFSTVAYRVGHSMINPHITMVSPSGRRSSKHLRSAFFNTGFFREAGMESLMRGAMYTLTGEIDVLMVDDVRNFLLGKPTAKMRLDLASLNIQRGRDHSMPSYNNMRLAHGFEAVRSFSEITKNAGLAARLQKVYGSVDLVDAWTGGLAEDHEPGSALGPLFTKMWVSQFMRLRDGDRFYFERQFQYDPQLLSRVKTARDLIVNKRLRGSTMRFIIASNTGIPISEMRENVFLVK